MKTTNLVLLASLLLSFPIWAAQCPAQKPDPKHCKYRDCPTAKWKTKDNRINTASACFQYKKGSLDYRNCRVYAKKIFEASCKQYRDSAKTRVDHKGCVERYCPASRMRP